MGWRRPCEALGKPKMPHHNVTLGPQWQTTSPRPTQVDDLSHLVRGEHCLPNSRAMTEVWGLLVQMGRTLRASSRAKFHGFTAGPYIPKMILETVGRVMHALGSGVRCGAILTDVAHHRTQCSVHAHSGKIEKCKGIASSNVLSSYVDNFLKSLLSPFSGHNNSACFDLQ